MKKIGFIICMLVCLNTASAETINHERVNRFVELTGFKKIIDSNRKQVMAAGKEIGSETFKQIIDKLPKDVQKQAKNDLDAVLEKFFVNMSELIIVEEVVTAYSKFISTNFTSDELNSLIRMYSSDTMQKFMSLNERSNEELERILTKNSKVKILYFEEELKSDLQTIIEKYVQ